MGILARSSSRVLCFGAAPAALDAPPLGSCEACIDRMRRAGTDVVALVAPDGPRQGRPLPVYATAQHAVDETGADAAIVDVPPALAADAMMEAIDAGLPLIVCRTRTVPCRDMVKVINYLQGSAGLSGTRRREGRTWLLGPGSPGVITPGAGMIGTLDPDLFTPGPAAIVSRSSHLAERAAARLTADGIGQSTCLVTSSALIIPTRLADVLGMLEADPETEVIVLIGGVGGRSELEAAAFIKEAVSKPVIAYLPGRHAPAGINVGAHGDFAIARAGEYEEKCHALRDAGAVLASDLDDLAARVAARLEP